MRLSTIDNLFPYDISAFVTIQETILRLRTIGLISTLAIGLLTAPLLVEAQQAGKMPRIGYLSFHTSLNDSDKAFRQALRNLGWIEGQNIAIEYRWAGRKRGRYPALAEELVRLKVDLIVTTGRTATQAAKNATKTIPIVMAVGADAVETGSLPALPGRAGTSRGCPKGSQSYIQNCWKCSMRPCRR